MGHPLLVSCLCITRNRVPLLRRAVSCFLGQTYQPRELVIVYESDDPATRQYIQSLNEPSILLVEVASSLRLRLGSLRNLSLLVNRGSYVAQWDDDDWHGPTRLADQVAAIHNSGKQGCVLWRWVVFDMETQSAYLSCGRAWEGSLVAERGTVPPYADLSHGEDTPVIEHLWRENKLTLLDAPELYIYVYHGGNSWNRSHWQNILSQSVPLARDVTERVISILRNEMNGSSR